MKTTFADPQKWVNGPQFGKHCSRLYVYRMDLLHLLRILNDLVLLLLFWQSLQLNIWSNMYCAVTVRVVKLHNSLEKMATCFSYVGDVLITRTSELVHDFTFKQFKTFWFKLKYKPVLVVLSAAFTHKLYFCILKRNSYPDKLVKAIRGGVRPKFLKLILF